MNMAVLSIMFIQSLNIIRATPFVITSITIIHGKGTGVLRKSVQSYLKGHKNIKSYRLGVFGEGENGVTIAEIK